MEYSSLSLAIHYWYKVFYEEAEMCSMSHHLMSIFIPILCALTCIKSMSEINSIYMTHD